MSIGIRTRVTCMLAIFALGCGDDGVADEATIGTESGTSSNATSGPATSATTSSMSGSRGSSSSADSADPTTTETSQGPSTTDPTTSESTTGSTTSDTQPPTGRPGGSVRFFGNGGVFDDRILIEIDDPTNDEPGPPIDVGNEDFTLEFWIRPDMRGNPNPAISCGSTNDWTTSNIIVDRDRHSQPTSYGVGIAGGTIVWAVQGPGGDPWSICGDTNVLDGQWHHVAVQRRRADGMLWIFVDGTLDTMQLAAEGDISFPDDGVAMDVCPAGVCDYSDPFLSLGAEKHGYEAISYAGEFDEFRVSTTLRYQDAFAPATAPFEPDDQTVGLYHFDEGEGTVATDASVHGTHGEIRYGGEPAGPQWTAENPFE